MPEGKNRANPITGEMMRRAAQNLIIRRDTHIDQLTDKLREDRVRRIIQPMLLGEELTGVAEDDLQYLVDLGLLRQELNGRIEIANPIYREVLPRALTAVTQASLGDRVAPTWVTPEGHLDLPRLLESFLAFWRQHVEALLGTASYPEAAPHLVLMAFLHRITNGEGHIEREYAIGRGRMDLCVRFAGKVFALELKVWRDNRPDPAIDGLGQIDGYLSGLGLTTGWLVIFDQRSNRPPIGERTSASDAQTPSGRTVTVIRA
jgi:hypothetical protein